MGDRAVVLLALFFLLPTHVYGTSSIEPTCRKSSSATEDTRNKYLVLITTFTGWGFLDVPTKTEENCFENDDNCIVNNHSPTRQPRDAQNVTWFLMDQYREFLGYKNSNHLNNTWNKQVYAGYCLARKLGFSSLDTEDSVSFYSNKEYRNRKMEWVEKYYKSNFSYFEESKSPNVECPTMRDFTKIYHAENFDFMNIILPVDVTLSSRVTQKFFEKYVKPKCSKYKQCAIISLGQASGSASKTDNTFHVENEICVNKHTPNGITSGHTKLSGDYLINTDIAKNASITYGQANTACGYQSFYMNEYCSRDDCNIPFLFIHIRRGNIYDVNSEDLCTTTQQFDEILESLFAVSWISN